jgi:Flp pilus assembly protein TadB
VSEINFWIALMKLKSATRIDSRFKFFVIPDSSKRDGGNLSEILTNTRLVRQRFRFQEVRHCQQKGGCLPVTYSSSLHACIASIFNQIYQLETNHGNVMVIGATGLMIVGIYSEKMIH